jgi:hypothetical protein
MCPFLFILLDSFIDIVLHLIEDEFRKIVQFVIVTSFLIDVNLKRSIANFSSFFEDL